MSEQTPFPQYRKYTNNRHFFKIVSALEFEEISFIGTKALVQQHTASIFPDKLFILDLLRGEEVAQQITEEEYNQQKISSHE